MHDQGKTQAQKNTWEYLKFTSQVDPWYGKSLQQSKQNKIKQNKNETATFEEGENLISRVTTLLDSNAFSTKKSQGMQKNSDV